MLWASSAPVAAKAQQEPQLPPRPAHASFVRAPVHGRGERECPVVAPSQAHDSSIVGLLLPAITGDGTRQTVVVAADLVVAPVGEDVQPQQRVASCRLKTGGVDAACLLLEDGEPPKLLAGLASYLVVRAPALVEVP